MSVRIQALEKRGADHRYTAAMTLFWGSAQGEILHAKMILAVSGGVDSLSLMHWLAHQDIISTDQMVVATIDHGLRPQSHLEAEQVSKLAADWGLPFVSRRFDTAALAAESGKSIEDAARAGRYQLLSAIANEVGATSIVTGHHMGDQAETILLHLLRGTGSRGLQGMHPVSNVPGDANGRLNLIRPMLSCTRDDIEAYAQHYQLRPAEDPSNRDVSFVRNRIRHELLPLLCEYNPQIVKTLSQLADHMQHERQLLDTLFKEAWQAICLTSSSRLIKLDLDRFTAAPVGIQRRVLREVVQQLTGSLENVSFDVIEQARKIVMRRETGLSADLGRQVQVRLTYGIIEGRSRLAPWQVEWEEEWPQLPLDIDTIPIALNRPSRHQLGHGFEIDVTLLDREQLDIRQTSENLWLAFIAVDDSSEIIIRRRMSGERFIPHGFDGHVKLKKLMIDRKIPAYVRENWPVVADQVGLLWIPGLRLAKRAAVQPDRPNHIIIKVEITRGN